MLFDDNSIIICNKDVKKKLLLDQNKNRILNNIKYFTFEEIQKKLFFDYDERTLYYLVNKGYSFNNAKEIINNLYYILDSNYENDKLNKLLNIKNELIDNNLLYFDELFVKGIKNKKIYVYGFIILSKWQKKIIELLKENNNLEIINIWNKNFKHKINRFESINDEIEWIANDIINKDLDLNHVFLANVSDDYLETIRRIFNYYKIPINIKNDTCLLDTVYGLNFIENYNLGDVDNPDIKNDIIDILNKYYFVNDIKSIKKILISEFKNRNIKSSILKNAVNIIDLKSYLVNDNDYIYLIGFNKEYIPVNYKDTDYIDDNIKMDYLDLTYEKNNNEIFIWQTIIKNIKNLTISFSDLNLSGSIKPSSLIDNNYEIERIDYKYSNYSNESNIYNLANILDSKIKYNVDNENMLPLINTYSHLDYLGYDNSYKNINKRCDNLSLSYTKLNSFYECPFKYYCSYILKLDRYEQTFDAYAGSLCHYILSKCYNADFDFDKAKDEFLSENKFELSLENKVFMEKMLNELKNVVKFLKDHLSCSKFIDIECEKEVNIKIDNVNFVGFIDKIMKYNDYVVVVDYKTGDTDIDLRLCGSGLKLQLPIYVYLLKSIYPDSKIVGIYLENIISPIVNYESGKTVLDQVNEHLKLNGYTYGCEDVIKDFDPTYENSDYIKSLKMTNNGFSSSSKVLTENDFNNLCKFSLKKIKEAIEEIENSNFKINPKVKGNDNISCTFCKFKSICFTTNKDITYITPDKELKYLEEIEGDKNV